MIDTELDTLARRVGEALAARGWRLATAESCTGGWIAEAVTAIGGSSAWFDRGFVTYSNEAKMDMLGVCAQALAGHGAVGGATACGKAAGGLAAGIGPPPPKRGGRPGGFPPPPRGGAPAGEAPGEGGWGFPPPPGGEVASLFENGGGGPQHPRH